MSSLSGKRILVTGGTGFIGLHLTEALIVQGADVHVFTSQAPDQFRRPELNGAITFWTGNLRSEADVDRCVRSVRPRIVFHLAAFRNVTRDPALTAGMIDVNVKGTMNVIHALLRERVALEAFINTGTCEEYGNGPVPFREDQREVPVSPYSASKVAATYFCQMMHDTMGVPVVTLRPFLTYGPYQKPDMLIPSLITHALAGKDFAMTAGDQTREFNYVSDVVEAYLLAAQRPAAIGQIINVGNGTEYTIRSVAEKVLELMGSPIRLLTGTLPQRAGETPHFYCDPSKARDILGWTSRTGLDEGLRRTIDWFQSRRTQLAQTN